MYGKKKVLIKSKVQVATASCAVEQITREELYIYHRGGNILSIQLADRRLDFCTAKKMLRRIYYYTANTILLNLDEMQIQTRKTRTI